MLVSRALQATARTSLVRAMGIYGDGCSGTEERAEDFLFVLKT